MVLVEGAAEEGFVMKPWFAAFLVWASIGACAADESDVPVSPPAQQRAARPRQAAPVAPAASSAASTTDAPKFTTEAKWLMAGYNNNEIVYTIIVTSQDSRIIRCTTEMQGFYIDNGDKQSISDRQVTTILPNQPTQVGNWMDMDQKSGATYQVKCKPV
jgi:hypothetical protein